MMATADIRETDEEAAEVWSAAVNSLPSEGLKFALNAASDTLPHNSSLYIWRRREGLTDGCKLCGRKQTLLHIITLLKTYGYFDTRCAAPSIAVSVETTLWLL